METQEALLDYFVYRMLHDTRGDLSSVRGQARLIAKILSERFAESEIPPALNGAVAALQASAERIGHHYSALALFPRRHEEEDSWSFVSSVLEYAITLTNHMKRHVKICLLVDRSASEAPKVHLTRQRAIIGLILLFYEICRLALEALSDEDLQDIVVTMNCRLISSADGLVVFELLVEDLPFSKDREFRSALLEGAGLQASLKVTDKPRFLLTMRLAGEE